MKIVSHNTDDQILHELGARLARLRLDRNLKQAELAAQAGVSLRTVQRLETGAVATQLSGFIRICRVLDLLDRIDALIPEPIPRPIEQLKLRGKIRRRASQPRVADRVSENTPWTWNDKP